MEIQLGNLESDEVKQLLQEHHDDMLNHSPVESVHALDLSGLKDPSVSFWTAHINGELAGCGALKKLSEQHAELKSMRTAEKFLRKGVAAKLLAHMLEVAQNEAACGCAPAKYWLHANMLLMNGRKMSKSDGNTISAQDLFSGKSEHVSKGYSPMVVRFFMLMAHYRSTLDLSDTALLAAEKGYKKLMEAKRFLQQVNHEETGSISDVDKPFPYLVSVK